MNNITITITGPGDVINFEYYLILKALRDAGIDVIEDNPYGYSGDAEPSKHITQIQERLSSGQIKNWAVQLNAKHIPWGG